MSYITAKALPGQFCAVSQPDPTSGELSDGYLSDIVGVKIRSVTHADYAAMKQAAEDENRKTRKPDGTSEGPMKFFCAMMKEHFSDLAHVITEDVTNSLLFWGAEASPKIVRNEGGYAALFVRPQKMATAQDHMSSACFQYSKEMMRGAVAGKPALWHEFNTLLRASECCGAGAYVMDPKLPPAFRSPRWKTEALALKAFMGRAQSPEDYEDRKLIANQFYAVRALVTIGNTHISAYESQILKRLGDPAFDETTIDAFSKARSEVCNFLGHDVHWGQGSGESFMIMHERRVAPMYRALKRGIEKQEITDPLQVEIAEDFLTAAEILFPVHLAEAAETAVALQSVPKTPLPESRQPGLLTRTLRSLLPAPK